MKRFKNFKNKKNTIWPITFIVFFCVFLNALILFNVYARKITPKINLLVNEKIDKIVYLFFSDLITDEVINKESVNNILEVTKNSKGEIVTVNYDLEKTYQILTNISKILKKGINDLEQGKINVLDYDKYLKNGPNGLILNVPFFIASDNIFLNNLGPQIPVLINFNESLLTNIKTKVTNYGFNNALLEIYVTVELQKLIITPLGKKTTPFNYDIIIGALVINGAVPEFYGGSYETYSNILDIPMD